MEVIVLNFPMDTASTMSELYWALTRWHSLRLLAFLSYINKMKLTDCFFFNFVAVGFVPSSASAPTIISPPEPVLRFKAGLTISPLFRTMAVFFREIVLAILNR